MSSNLPRSSQSPLNEALNEEGERKLLLMKQRVAWKNAQRETSSTNMKLQAQRFKKKKESFLPQLLDLLLISERSNPSYNKDSETPFFCAFSLSFLFRKKICSPGHIFGVESR
jgi:hypothetical protein